MGSLSRGGMRMLWVRHRSTGPAVVFVTAVRGPVEGSADTGSPVAHGGLPDGVREG